MMKNALDKLRRKLADQQGDSMVEALTAILIAVLGATMLATMVMASVSTASRSEHVLNASYQAEAEILGSSANLEVSSVTIPGDSGTSSTTATTGITLYSSDEYEFYREGKRL